MSNEKDDQNTLVRFTFASDGLPANTFKVVKFEGTEAISTSFRFDLTLVSQDPDVDFDQVLSNSADFTILSNDGQQKNPYRGLIREFEQLGKVNQLVFYRALLVPRAARLLQTRINEVFVDNQTVPEVIERVLKKHDISALDYQFILKDPSQYPRRSLISQHQETDFDFIARLLEGEGIYYFHEKADAERKYDKVSILDYKEGHPAAALKLRYTAREDLPTVDNEQCVTAFIARQTPLPKSVIVQDYDYQKANLANDLKATVTVSAMGDGEMMFFGGNLRTIAQAERQANIRAEEIRCHSKVFHGEARAVGIRSGYLIELTEHYRQSFNDQYLVTSVEHRGSQASAALPGQTSEQARGEQGSSYDCTFTAIPASVQFRPQRVTPKPLISGTMSALIDSEGSGEMAEMNEYGEYKVQLLYDLSDKSLNKGSAWIRMASQNTGNRNGMHFPLRKGSEVLLSFAGGDPDQPVIVASAPNSNNPSVSDNTNPYLSGLTTARGNSIVFNDKPGSVGVQTITPVSQVTQAGTGLFAGTYSWSMGMDYSMSLGTKVQLGVSASSAINLSLKNDLVMGWVNEVIWGNKNSSIRGGALEFVTGGEKLSYNFSKASGKGKTGGSTNSNSYQVITGLGGADALFFGIEAISQTWLKWTKWTNFYSVAISSIAASAKLGYSWGTNDKWFSNDKGYTKKLMFDPDWTDWALIAPPVLGSVASYGFYKAISNQQAKQETQYLTRLNPTAIQHTNATSGIFMGVRGPDDADFQAKLALAPASLARKLTGNENPPPQPPQGSTRIYQTSTSISFDACSADRQYVTDASGKNFTNFIDGVYNLTAMTLSHNSISVRSGDSIYAEARTTILQQSDVFNVKVGDLDNHHSDLMQTPTNFRVAVGKASLVVNTAGLVLRGGAAAAPDPNDPNPVADTEAAITLSDATTTIRQSPQSSIVLSPKSVTLTGGTGQIVIAGNRVSIGSDLVVNQQDLSKTLSDLESRAKASLEETKKDLKAAKDDLALAQKKIDELKAQQEKSVKEATEYQKATDAQNLYKEKSKGFFS